MTGQLPIKARRVSAGLNPSRVAIRASMGMRTLVMIEEGKLHATPAILDRVNVAIDSLIAEDQRGPND